MSRFRGDVFTSQYNISILPANESIIASTLVMEIVHDLNGTLISCLEAINMQVKQQAVITVLGNINEIYYVGTSDILSF